MKNKNQSVFFLVISWMLFGPFPVFAADIPSAGQSGLTDKLIRQSRPKLKPRKKEKPEIIIKDSRRLKDPGAGPAFFVKRIELEGNTVFDNSIFAPMLEMGEGEELTLGILSLMASEVTAYYATNGYFLARTYIPKQEIKNGVVKMVVSEGKIGEIKVEGNKKIKSDDILKRFRKVKKEKILTEQSLEQVLTDLNALMGVKVRSILKPGELPGTSDLILEVTETPPYIFSFDGDNYGSRYTGQNRFGISASAGNLIRLGDQFSMRVLRSDLGQNYIQGSFLYPFTIPFTEYDASIKISHTYSEQDLGDDLISLEAGGNSNTFLVELSKILYRTKSAQITMKAAFDSRHSKNFQLGEITSNDNINGVYLNFGGNFSDKFKGMNFIDLKLRRGLGGSDKNHGLTSRAEGQGEVFVSSATLMRFQGVPFMSSYFLLKASGQMTSARALSGDLFAAGGMGTVRGFPISEYSGDGGYLTSAEYNLPFPYKLPIGIEKLTLAHILSLTAFIEHGAIYVRNKQSGEYDHSITGGGLGMQLNFPKIKWFPAFTFAVSYGVPFGGQNPSDGSYGTWYLNGLMNYTF